MERDRSVDIAKGIAIIAVVFGHCVIFPYTRFIYSWHMPLFFILAGYFFRKKEIKGAVIADFYRLIVPYLIFGSISCIKFTLTKSILGDWNTVINNWLGFFWTNSTNDHTSYFFNWAPGIGFIWFLPALFWCKNFYNWLSNNTHNEYILYSIGGGGSVIATLLDVYVINLPFGILTGSSAVMFYMIGHYAKVHSVPKWFICVSIACWVIGVNYSHLFMGNCHYGMYPIDVIGACGGTWVILKLSKGIDLYGGKIGTFLSWMGRYSLVVLCMHYIDALIDINGRLNTQQWYVYIALQFCIILPLTYVSTKLKSTKKIFLVR